MKARVIVAFLLSMGLMKDNSLLQRTIDDVLGPQQPKKLDALWHKAEVSVVHDS